MKLALRLLNPSPLAFLFLLVSISMQVVFCSSTTITSSGGSTHSVYAMGLGSPIRLISEGDQTSLRIRWGTLSLNALVTYLVCTLLSNAIARATRLRAPAKSYCLLGFWLLAAAFLISITISKVYWGYFIAPPKLLAEARKITKVRAILMVKTAQANSGHVFISDNEHALAESLYIARRDGDDGLYDRILLELERKNLIPSDFDKSWPELQQLYSLVRASGELVPSTRGYDSSGQLRGMVVDAMGDDKRLVFVCLTGGQLSNDHYPYYELLFGGPPEARQLNFIRGQRYYYDAAGMEGFEWYIIWPMLAIPTILAGFLIFTAVKTLPRTE